MIALASANRCLGRVMFPVARQPWGMAYVCATLARGGDDHRAAAAPLRHRGRDRDLGPVGYGSGRGGYGCGQRCAASRSAPVHQREPDVRARGRASGGHAAGHGRVGHGHGAGHAPGGGGSRAGGVRVRGEGGAGGPQLEL
eukprot:1800805-Rhodomonas_salina.2